MKKTNLKLHDNQMSLGSFTNLKLAAGEEELADLTTENEENIKVFEEDKGRLTMLIEDQDAMLNQIEASLAAKGLDVELKLKEDKINKLVSEAEALLLKKDEAEKLVSKLQEKIGAISESSRSTENEMKELRQKMPKLEEETEKHDQEMDSLAKQVDQLQHIVQEKEELLLEVKKKLDDQINEFLQMKQDNDEKELSLKAHHSEELKRVESEANLKIASVRSDHEAEMKALKSQHEDALRKLQNELDFRRDKEDKVRALLERMLEVMGKKRGDDGEVNSNRVGSCEEQ